MYRIAFFGTPKFSLPFLEELHLHKNFDLKLVVAQPDKPQGRGKKILPPPTIEFAKKHSIPHQQPSKLTGNQEVINLLRSLDLDFIVVVAYGKILKSEILEIPKLGCINVHPSRLPKYRGPSPIQYSLLNGDKDTAITIMLMNEGMDSGDILNQYEIPILPEDNYQSLETKILETGPKNLSETINLFVEGKIKPVQQDDSSATYCYLIKKEDARIVPSSESVSIVLNKIRAYSAWPISSLEIDIEHQPAILKIHKAKKSSTIISVGHIGIIENKLILGCANGSIEILEAQLPNKKTFKAKELVNFFNNKSLVI
jgi:methionyl-tRNA formyltransferase